MSEDETKFTGFACPMDGTGCKPLTSEEASALWRACEEADARRAAAMPTEKDALQAMHDAYIRLKDLGWQEAIYCPKDGTMFDAIEPGSTGIHDCVYEGKWPDGSWWVYEAGDVWPSRPCLYRPRNRPQSRIIKETLPREEECTQYSRKETTP